MVNSYPYIFKLRVVRYYLENNIKVSELLNIFKISRGSLYNWINQYNNNELSEKETYTKRSKFINVKGYICNYVTTRKTFDYNRLIFIIKKRYNINISKSSLYNILKERNITRKRVNIRMNICNSKKFNKLKKTFRRKIKKVGINKVISIDESSFDTHIHNNYGWSAKGEDIKVIKKNKRIRYSVISGISNDRVILTKIIKGSINRFQFMDFMKEIIEKTDKKYKFLMDNALIHKTKILSELMNSHKREIIYNIPYSPEYNPIEMVFSKVKSMVRRRRQNELIDNLKRNIMYGFNKITKKDLRGYFRKSLTF